MDDDRAALTGRSALAPPRRLAPALAALPVALLAAGFAWPLASMARRGLGTDGLGRILGARDTWRVLWFTMWQALASTAVTFAVAAPLTLAIAHYGFRGRRLVLALVAAPFVLPTVVVGTAIGATLPASWRPGVGAVLVAHAYMNAAVVVRTVGLAWSRLDPRYVDAARTLGAGRWHGFRTVTAPLLRGSLVAAAAIVFLFTFTSFGIIRILAGPRHPTLEVELWRRATQADVGRAAALGLVQLVAVVTTLAVWHRAQRRPTRVGTSRGRPELRRPRTVRERAFVAAACVATLVALLVPIARLVQRSLRVGDHYGLTWYRSLRSSGAGTTRALRPLAAMTTTLSNALIAALVATAVGTLASYAIAFGRRRAGGALDAGLMLPLGTSAVTLGIGLFLAYGRPPVDLRASPLLVPMAHALVGIPFVVRTVLPTLRSIDPRLAEAAATLGSTRWRAWWTVELPLVRRSLVAGAGFAAAVSLGEFGATSFLARRATTTIPVAIVDLLGRPGASNVGQAYALAVLLTLVTAAVFLVADAGDRRQDATAGDRRQDATAGERGRDTGGGS